LLIHLRIFTPQADYSVSSIPVSEERARGSAIKVLSDKEIEAMRKVCKIGREVLDIGAAAIRPGITTDEIGK
jgi:methionyl aminopeptidase